MRTAVALAQGADLLTFALVSSLSAVPGGEYNLFAVYLYESSGLLGIALAKIAGVALVIAFLSWRPEYGISRFLAGFAAAWGVFAAVVNLLALVML